MKFKLVFASAAITLSLGIILADNCYAQNKSGSKDKKSSYKVYRDRSSTSSANSILDEAEDLKVSSPAESLTKVQEALGLSIAQGDEFTEAKCYLLLGEINENIQEWRLAFDNYTKAYQ